MNPTSPQGFALREALDALCLLLAPFAPHMAEELWQRLGGAGSIFQETWPRHDPELALADTITLVVQVNGKVRARLEAPAGLPAAEIEARALADPKITALLGTQAVRKVIVVPDKLVNLVVG